MPLRSKLDIRISHLLLIKTSLSPNLLKLFLLCVTLSSNHHIEVCCKDTNVTLCTPWKTSTTWRAFHPRMSFGCFLWLSYLQKKRRGAQTKSPQRVVECKISHWNAWVLFHCVLFFFSHPFSQTDGALIFRHFSPSLGCFGVMERRVTRYLFRFA